MPVKIDVESGGEYLLPYAKKELERLKETARLIKVPQLSKKVMVDTGAQIFISTQSINSKLCFDSIRIIGNNPQYAYAQNGGTLYTRFQFNNEKPKQLAVIDSNTIAARLLHGVQSTYNLASVSKYELASRVFNSLVSNSPTASFFDGSRFYVSPSAITAISSFSSSAGALATKLLSKYYPPDGVTVSFAPDPLSTIYSGLDTVFRDSSYNVYGTLLGSTNIPIGARFISSTTLRQRYLIAYATPAAGPIVTTLQTYIRNTAGWRLDSETPLNHVLANTFSAYISAFGTKYQYGIFSAGITNGSRDINNDSQIDTDIDFPIGLFSHPSGSSIQRMQSGNIKIISKDGTTKVIEVPLGKVINTSILTTPVTIAFNRPYSRIPTGANYFVDTPTWIIDDDMYVAPPIWPPQASAFGSVQVNLNSLNLGCIYNAKTGSYLYAYSTAGNFTTLQNAYIANPTPKNLTALMAIITVVYNAGMNNSLAAFINRGNTVVLA